MFSERMLLFKDLFHVISIIALSFPHSNNV